MPLLKAFLSHLTVALSFAMNLGERVKIRRHHHVQGSWDDYGRPGTQADGLEENIPRTDAESLRTADT